MCLLLQGCVDFYNPAPIDHAGVTFIFPSATRHLVQQDDPSYPNPFTSCRTLNAGFLDVRMAFSRMEPGLPLTFERLGSTLPVVSRGMGHRDPLTGIYTNQSEWDAGMVFMGSGLVSLPSEPGYSSQYYFGSQFTHGFEAYHLGEQYPLVQRGLGRLRWRQEGFVALATRSSEHRATEPAGWRRGTVLTRPVLLSAAAAAWRQDSGRTVELALNVETSVSGSVVVDLLDGASGETIPGFHSLPIVGNEVRLIVVWNASMNLPPALKNYTCHDENGPTAMPSAGSVVLTTDIFPAFALVGESGVILRISMQDAQLYSITFVPGREKHE
jgi:hypothetical protein